MRSSQRRASVGARLAPGTVPPGGFALEQPADLCAAAGVDNVGAAEVVGEQVVGLIASVLGGQDQLLAWELLTSATTASSGMVGRWFGEPSVQIRGRRMSRPAALTRRSAARLVAAAHHCGTPSAGSG